MRNTLESSKYFTPIAWTVVILFALFTYSLTLRLERSLSSLEEKTNALEQAVRENATTKPQEKTDADLQTIP